MIDTTLAPVLKTITVKASTEKAFRVFTAGLDTWWPKTHHIGKSPMTRGILEGRVGGRCYSEQEDGTECDWGEVLVWEPPHRFIMAWKVTPQWGYEPDAAKSSEVEVRFTSMGDATRVDLEHRYFERHGAGADVMRTSIDSPGGWGGLMEMFRTQAEAA
jgi:hypothetical protein